MLLDPRLEEVARELPGEGAELDRPLEVAVEGDDRGEAIFRVGLGEVASQMGHVQR